MSSDDDLWLAQVGDLTDALALGRLTAGELAALAPLELDALYELGAQRLETDRLDDAAAIFAGLITLFPYTGRYWRAYGVALHRLMQLDRAAAAYEAALALEPEHLLTRVYRAEVLIYAGRADEAVEDLELALSSPRLDLRQRAERLCSLAQALADWHPAPTAPPRVLSGTFALSDGTPLPLADSRFPPADAAPEKPDEITLTAQTVVPEVSGLWEPPTGRRATAPLTDAAVLELQAAEATITRTMTQGAQSASAPKPAPKREQPPARRATLSLRRVTETALIPGRPRALAMLREAATQPVPAASDTRDKTQTAIVRRRRHEPLCDELTFQEGDLPRSPSSGESEWDS